MALTLEEKINKITADLARAQNDIIKIVGEQEALEKQRRYALGERSAYQNALDVLKEN